MSEIVIHRFENGLTLAVEPISGVTSVGMSLLAPAGVVSEPAERVGVGEVLSEMLFRGAGGLDSREHSDALDMLGVNRGIEVQSRHMRLGASFLGDRLDRAMPLIAEMVRRPRLPDSAMGPAVDLALAGLEGLEDEPQQKVMVELKRHHLGEPLGRPTHGEIDALEAMDMEDVRGHFDRNMVGGGSILSLAGAVDVGEVIERVGGLFEDWSGESGVEPAGSGDTGGRHHIDAESAQSHIGLAYDAPAAGDQESMTQRLAIAVLSGGMSSRLFTEVREKRGLCYSVYASYVGMKDRGVVYAYAGTTPQRAKETLEVMRSELCRIGEGVEPEEYERAMVGLKSRIVMQGESTGARARAIAADIHLRGRPRSLEELAAEVEGVTLDRLNGYLRSCGPKVFTTLTIGPEALD